MDRELEMFEQELEAFFLEFVSTGAFWIALAAIAGVLIFGVLCYVFHAVGLSKIAKRRVVSGRWMGSPARSWSGAASAPALRHSAKVSRIANSFFIGISSCYGV